MSSDRAAVAESLFRRLPNSDETSNAVPEAREPRHQGRSSQATRLLELIGKAELFRSPEGKPHVTFETEGHCETHALRSSGARQWLQRLWFEHTSGAVSSQALEDTLGHLESRARFGGKTYPVAVRIATEGECIYLDLGNSSWETVQVDCFGWEVIAKPPVRFRRPPGLGEIPRPMRGGHLDLLRPFVNVGDEAQWTVLLAFLVASLRGRGPYPVLVVNGEQGSAKSTTCRVIRALLDPIAAGLRSAPSNERDLMIAAMNSWLVAFDNLSHVPPWLSDALCRLSTGGGLATRTLYSDEDETVFQAQRPCMLNGIGDLATRGDLLDRALLLRLPHISDSQRRREDQFWSDFAEKLPQILGALLSAVSSALAGLPKVALSEAPRMIDFATWAVAAEPGLGLRNGAFMAAYRENRDGGHDLVLEASPLVGLLCRLVSPGETWEGSATELWQALDALATDSMRSVRGILPANASALSNRLRRLAPSLRAKGIVIEFPERQARRRTIVIRMEPDCTVIGVIAPRRSDSSDGNDGSDGVGALLSGRWEVLT